MTNLDLTLVAIALTIFWAVAVLVTLHNISDSLDKINKKLSCVDTIKGEK
jgi:uncharacterized protein YoxC